VVVSVGRAALTVTIRLGRERAVRPLAAGARSRGLEKP
jgi:hypothetical protein